MQQLHKVVRCWIAFDWREPLRHTALLPPEHELYDMGNGAYVEQRSLQLLFPMRVSMGLGFMIQPAKCVRTLNQIYP